MSHVCITLNIGGAGERNDEFVANDAARKDKDLVTAVKSSVIKTHKNHRDMSRSKATNFLFSDTQHYNKMVRIKEHVFGMPNGQALNNTHHENIPTLLG